MKKSAFTLLELIFVIVVIGILSAVFIPRFGQNKLSQAANQLISNIRYTQHLALIDDTYDENNATWYKNRWSINLCQAKYKIMSDTRTALDPLTKEPMDGNFTKQYNLLTKYGVNIQSPASNGLCNITFDHLGRPYSFASTPVYPTPSPTDGLIHAPYDINITNGADSLIIRVEAETGYVHLK
ncbi:MAG: type II secretion system protein [Thiovulaceae bacterium]|nr:type II secretion system protein [Sulfurimonadaceae bacterium]